MLPLPAVPVQTPKAAPDPGTGPIQDATGRRLDASAFQVIFDRTDDASRAMDSPLPEDPMEIDGVDPEAEPEAEEIATASEDSATAPTPIRAQESAGESGDSVTERQDGRPEWAILTTTSADVPHAAAAVPNALLLPGGAGGSALAQPPSDPDIVNHRTALAFEARRSRLPTPPGAPTVDPARPGHVPGASAGPFDGDTPRPPGLAPSQSGFAAQWAPDTTPQATSLVRPADIDAMDAEVGPAPAITAFHGAIAETDRTSPTGTVVPAAGAGLPHSLADSSGTRPTAPAHFRPTVTGPAVPTTDGQREAPTPGIAMPSSLADATGMRPAALGQPDRQPVDRPATGASRAPATAPDALPSSLADRTGMRPAALAQDLPRWSEATPVAPFSSAAPDGTFLRTTPSDIGGPVLFNGDASAGPQASAVESRERPGPTAVHPHLPREAGGRFLGRGPGIDQVAAGPGASDGVVIHVPQAAGRPLQAATLTDQPTAVPSSRISVDAVAASAAPAAPIRSADGPTGSVEALTSATATVLPVSGPVQSSADDLAGANGQVRQTNGRSGGGLPDLPLGATTPNPARAAMPLLEATSRIRPTNPEAAATDTSGHLGKIERPGGGREISARAVLDVDLVMSARAPAPEQAPPMAALSAAPVSAAGAPPVAPVAPVAPVDLPNRLSALVEDIQIRTRDATVTTPHRTEIELAPATLGRIRVTLETGDRGLQLAIQTDRPETVDVIRRQIEILHRSLVADGVPIDRVDLSSGPRSLMTDGSQGQSNPTDSGPEGDRDPTRAHPDRPQAPTTGQAETPPEATAQGKPTPGITRLDLRL